MKKEWYIIHFCQKVIRRCHCYWNPSQTLQWTACKFVSRMDWKTMCLRKVNFVTHTVRRIKNRTVCINSILLRKNGLLKPNTDEYVAHVFVVNGSAFGLDGKLHRAWQCGKWVGEVVDGEAALNCKSNYGIGHFVMLVSAQLLAWDTKNSWPFGSPAKNLPNVTLLVIVVLFV